MDIIHDNSRRQLMQLAAIVGAGNLPDYVQDYSVPDAKIASALGDEFYADPGKRLYPIDSKGAAWLSAGYYVMSKQAESFEDLTKHPTLMAIKFAADVYGIGPDVDKLVQAIATFSGATKNAAASDDDYGWLIKNAAGDVIRRRYPMFDATGVVKAAMYFDENRRHYPLDVRKGIAGKIVEKAAKYGVSGLPESVRKEAGEGIPRRSVIMQELGERAKLAKDAEFAQLVDNVNKLLKTADEAEIVEAMDKLASTIEAFDQAEGLVRHYGTKISYPADFLMSITAKEAQDFAARTVVLKQHAFDVEKLAKCVPLDQFEAALGEEFAKKIAAAGAVVAKQLKAALEALPPAEKSALEKHLTLIYG